MNWNQMKSQWPRVRAQLKSQVERLYGALKDDWLAKLRLRDHYAERRPPS